MKEKPTREQWEAKIRDRSTDTQRRLVALYEFAHQLCRSTSSEYERPYGRGRVGAERAFAVKVVARIEHALGQILDGKEPDLAPKIAGPEDHPEGEDWTLAGHEFYLKLHERASGVWREDCGASALEQPLWPERKTPAVPKGERPRHQKHSLLRRVGRAIGAMQG